MKLESFIDRVSTRLNHALLLRALTVAGLIFGSVSIVIALVYICRGYAAPGWGYLVGGSLSLGALAMVVWRQRVTRDQAARYADQFFDLKDGVVSARFLTGEKGSAMQELQRKWLETRLQAVDARSIPLDFSRKLATLALILGLCAMTMSFVPASERVVSALADEQATLERSQEAVEQIQEVVSEMENDLSEDERQEIPMDELRKMVEDLKPHKDRSTVSRQFARVEQRAREMSKQLEQKQDEQSLEEAIKELKKSSNKQAKKLADQLEKSDIKAAQKELNKLKPKEQSKPLSKKEMAELRKKLENLREVSKRMAAGARANSASSASGAAGQGGGLGDEMAGMDLDAQQLEEMLKQLELSQMRNEKIDWTPYNEQVCKFCKSCDKVGCRLQAMKARQSAQCRLNKLCKNLSQCQNYCNKKGQSLCLSPVSGMKPGSASTDQRKDPGDELQANGDLQQLKGQKGAGPSLSKVEEAESGTGVSSNRITAKARDYSRQMEAFIERDNVPEELKSGVKEYFKTIHNTEMQ